MKIFAKAGLAAAAMSVVAAFAPASFAADLGGSWGRGSIKDDHLAAPRSAAGPCYFRADVGYSWSATPDLRWSAWNPPLPYKEQVSGRAMDDTWTGAVGAGCGSGSRGFRYEVMLGYHGERGVSGVTAPFQYFGGDPASSKITSSITSYTGMINGYYDLGSFGGFVPYVGAGVGLAYHQMGDYLISHPSAPANVPWKVAGDNDLTMAWSLMAGVGYQISDRAIFDVGYRYIDLGRAATARNDVFAGGNLSRFTADELAAHEFKVGLRYHFGGDTCCSARPVSMK